MSPMLRVLVGLAVGLVGAAVALVTLPFCVTAAGCGGAAVVFFDSEHHQELVEILGYLLIPSGCGSVVSLPLLVLGAVIVMAGPRVRARGVGGERDSDNVFDPPRSEG